MLRRRRFRWAFERASKINAQAPRAESAQSVLSTGHAAVTTSSKFKAQKFWRGVMRPLAPARSGNARGRARDAGASGSVSGGLLPTKRCGCEGLGLSTRDMPNRRSQDQPRHDAAVLKKHGYKQ